MLNNLIFNLSFANLHFMPLCLMCGDSSWTVHCVLVSLQSFSLSLLLSISLEDSSATGASEALERSLGKEEQRAVHLQPSPHCTSSAPSPPVLPSLGPLAHWPVPQIKTSDKKMGSLKRGRERKNERKKEVHNKPRGAERQSLCCWMAGPLCRL